MHDSPPAPRNIETPRDAEQLAAEWMRYWGYRDAQVTAQGADGGLDVVARDAVAQVKYYAPQIGRPALQNLVGASHGHNGDLLFFTTSAYAKPALEYADQVGMALFVIEPFGRMRPVNESAEQVAAREEERRREEEHAREAEHCREEFLRYREATSAERLRASEARQKMLQRRIDEHREREKSKYFGREFKPTRLSIDPVDRPSIDPEKKTHTWTDNLRVRLIHVLMLLAVIAAIAWSLGLILGN